MPPPASAAAAERPAIAVDWSGARRGERRKIWLAEAAGGRLLRLESGRTRAEVVAHLIERARAAPELVVGLDFSFSFPAWFCASLGVASVFELWELVAREGERWIASGRPPFWGRRGTRRPPSDPKCPLFRCTESAHLAVRGVGPKSTFQIAGAGAVGTGSLRGMPWLPVLRAHGFAVWPFDPPVRPLALEIYPRFLTGPVVKSRASARRLYLSTSLPGQDPALLERAASGEDAFDAAVSALRMSAERSALERLERLDRWPWSIEGCLWHPALEPGFHAALR